MTHFALQRCARLVLYATLARGALACGADTDHGPPIGSPPGPTGPIVSEGGAPGNAGGSGTDTGGTNMGTDPQANGGAISADSGGRDAFGTAGNGSAGRDPFGIAGSSAGSDPFGIGGSPSAFSGGSSF